ESIGYVSSYYDRHLGFVFGAMWTPGGSGQQQRMMLDDCYLRWYQCSVFGVVVVV
ncbi:hypothetical protein A2U01_0089655, partial [Trifolium medium]|nr:hypothetical protein [Trifolium medium]